MASARCQFPAPLNGVNQVSHSMRTVVLLVPTVVLRPPTKRWVTLMLPADACAMTFAGISGVPTGKVAVWECTGSKGARSRVRVRHLQLPLPRDENSVPSVLTCGWR